MARTGRPRRPDKPCEFCGEMFHGQRRDQRYCSHRCSARAQRGADPELGYRVCEVDGCDRKGTHYGLCEAHNLRKRKHGDVLAHIPIRERRPNGSPPKPKDPQKALAVSKLNDAVKLGAVQRPERCEGCGARGRIEGHHHDYTKPYDVTWLCRACHVAEHSLARHLLATERSAA